MSPIPEHLLIGAHSRAALLGAGLTEAELAGPLWARLSQGMYAWAAATPDLPGQLRRLGSLVPPGGALGGWAAAHLLGATELDGMTDDGRPLPVLLCAGRQQTCRRTTQARVWRSDLADDDVVRTDGTPVTSPCRTRFDIARLCPFTARSGRDDRDGEEALVVLGEYDGGDHSGSARRASDHVRVENLEALGLIVVRVAGVGSGTAGWGGDSS